MYKTTAGENYGREGIQKRAVAHPHVMISLHGLFIAFKMSRKANAAATCGRRGTKMVYSASMCSPEESALAHSSSSVE